MAHEIRVPTLGESIVEATVGKWLKQVGEPVKSGEALVELETDKVTVEVAAEADGVLAEVLHQEGDNVSVGDVLGRLVPAGAAQGDGAAQTAPQPAQAAPQPQPAPQPAQALTPAPPPAQATPQTEPQPTQAAPAERRGAVRATPVAQRMAAANQIDLRGLTGSGPGGMVTKEDIAAHLDRAPSQAAPQPAPAPAPARPSAPAPAAPVAPAGPEERIRMSRRRRTIAQRLVEAQHTAAMLTTFNEVDMSAVMALRKRRGEEFQKRHGIKLGFMSFFVKAVVGALKTQPLLNAEIQGDEIVIKRYYDIGIAVATEEGLVVPVLRGADRLSFAAIERGIAELAEKARNGTLSLSELQGGTFTITNGGVFGSLLSTPILNAPQVGILGMHAIKERPVAVNGQVEIRPMMYLALSYDHRIVDGSEAVRFLVHVKELIEDPERLLLEG